MTFRITALSITIKKMTLSINDIEHQNAQNPCAQCHDAGHFLFTLMLNVIMLNIILLRIMGNIS
jgi:hypothetical protein